MLDKLHDKVQREQEGAERYTRYRQACRDVATQYRDNGDIVQVFVDKLVIDRDGVKQFYGCVAPQFVDWFKHDSMHDRVEVNPYIIKNGEEEDLFDEFRNLGLGEVTVEFPPDLKQYVDVKPPEGFDRMIWVGKLQFTVD